MCRQTHSTKHQIKIFWNLCQMHQADSSRSIFCLIYMTAPLLFTLETLENSLFYSYLLLDLLHTAGGSSTFNLELNNSTLRFNVRTKRFLLSRMIFCNVCLPNVVFWFEAYSRNNTVTHKNRKWTKKIPVSPNMPCPKLPQYYKLLHSSSIASEFEEEAK